MTTYQRAGASKYVNTLAYSKSGYPNSGLSFAVLGAAIVTHVRWKSPAVRYELMVGRTVNVVNFDVVPLLYMFQNLNRSTIIHLVVPTSKTRPVNIVLNLAVSSASIFPVAEGYKYGC